MPYYESVYIARQEISAQQVDSITDSFEEVIKEAGGRIAKRESWGLKNLAYRIKKSRKAHYTLMNIDAPADAVHEMERQMRLNEDVLRYLTLRVDELEEEPSIQAQSKSDRSHENSNGGEFRARQNELSENGLASEGDTNLQSTADDPSSTEAPAEALATDEGENK